VHDELRMFAQATSRARSEVLVTAVENEDNRPSVFFRMLPERDPDPVARYPLSLRGLVGRFRRDLTGAIGPRAGRLPESLQPGTTPAGTTQAGTTPTGTTPTGTTPLVAVPPRARDAALALARLAAEGVPGADPGSWYGVRPPSTVQPINDPEAGDGPVRVSPSKMASFESCPLHWLIGQIGGGGGSTAASLGTIIHKVMEDAVDPSPDALWAAVEERWGELTFDAEWQSHVQKTEARRLTDRLAAYLADFRRNGSTLLSAEGGFEFAIGNAVLSGTVDRVEQLADGRAVIVDLKTGKGDPIADDGVVDHPQLGAYQLAFHEGAIDGIAPGTDLAGAQLVIVSSGTTKKNYRDPMQQPFTPEQREAFRERVLADAAGMGGSVFLARMDEHCLDPWSFGSCRVHIIKQVSS
jgi:RecB family exonuclease